MRTTRRRSTIEESQHNDFSLPTAPASAPEHDRTRGVYRRITILCATQNSDLPQKGGTHAACAEPRSIASDAETRARRSAPLRGATEEKSKWGSSVRNLFAEECLLVKPRNCCRCRALISTRLKASPPVNRLIGCAVLRGGRDSLNCLPFWPAKRLATQLTPDDAASSGCRADTRSRPCLTREEAGLSLFETAVGAVGIVHSVID
jgi:hypothetical protein